jgi:serine protease
LSGITLEEDLPWDQDEYGHGTEMTGVINAREDNNVGIVSVAPESDVFIVRLFRDGFRDFEVASTVLKAAETCFENGAKIINMSFGSGKYLAIEEEGFANLVSRGALIIAASGNSFEPDSAKPLYPASYEKVISVAAVTKNNERRETSIANEFVDIAAPGEDVETTAIGPDERFLVREVGGTSIACAHVSGVAALLWSHVPHATAEEVRAALLYSTLDLGPPGRDDSFGYGLVQAMDALQ